MFKQLWLACTGTLMLMASAAHAEVDPNYRMVLLTENFPPYNMAINGKNFAQEDNLDGIAVDIVREMFKRAGIQYNLTLRFPWDRIYKLALEKPGYGVFVTARLPEREALFKWVGPIGPDDWVLLARGDSAISLSSLEQAKQYKVGAYKGDAISEYLTEKGLKVRRVNKVLEGRPHIVDALKNGEVQMIFNTTETAQSIADSRSIRTTALQQKIPCITTISGARAMVRGLEVLQKETLEVLPLQSYYH